MALEDTVVKDAAEKKGDYSSFLPTRVSTFDSLVETHGLERGTTILVAGGCGTGKSTFTMQSLYNGLEAGESAAYISFEEPINQLRKNMLRNFGWDLAKYEKNKRLVVLKQDPFKIARSVEASVIKKRGGLLIEVEEFKFPFNPDRVVIDSLSALSIAFMGNIENYRYYVRYLFDKLDSYKSVNFVITETELDPGIYSRSGIEEFLADGVIVLYNIKVNDHRERALEVLKLRSSNHTKAVVPFRISRQGIDLISSSDVTSKIRKWQKSRATWV